MDIYLLSIDGKPSSLYLVLVWQLGGAGPGPQLDTRPVASVQQGGVLLVRMRREKYKKL